jgi:hypothetical protein
MTTESVNDAFERRYMGKFQAKAAEYGVAVKYERDRAARDIGIHFYRRKKSGDEVATGSLVWFQMKGFRSKTVPKEKFAKSRSLAVPLRVKDLQLWFRMNGPTYLVVYVESVDTFLILNIGKYVAEQYGPKVFDLGQKELNVPISTKSVLDAQAFELMIRQGTAEEWTRSLRADEADVRLAQRDYQLIWRLGGAEDRQVEHRVEVRDWQSKLRGEVYFHERKIDGSDQDWESIRTHWQFMLRARDLETAYPYLSFEPFNEEHQNDVEFESNEDGEPFVEFSDGSVVYGHDCCGEYNLYELRPQLNETGARLMAMIATLVRTGMIEPPTENDAGEVIDVAPWHHRDV